MISYNWAEQVADESDGERAAGYGYDISPDAQFDCCELLDELDIPVMFAEETAQDIVIGKTIFSKIGGLCLFFTKVKPSS